MSLVELENDIIFYKPAIYEPYDLRFFVPSAKCAVRVAAIHRRFQMKALDGTVVHFWRGIYRKHPCQRGSQGEE